MTEFKKYPSLENHYQNKFIDYAMDHFGAEVVNQKFIAREKLDGSNIQLVFTPDEKMKVGRRTAYLEDGEKFNDIWNTLEKYQNLISNYQAITDLSNTLIGLIEDGAYIQRGEKKFAIQNFKEAVDWLGNEARRGLHIQRYKGLGEMNPNQLWETTMNAETRNLLQVRIEDVVACDEIFTTLMGDQVEPRRNFIEENALSVVNLDT